MTKFTKDFAWKFIKFKFIKLKWAGFAKSVRSLSQFVLPFATQSVACVCAHPWSCGKQPKNKPKRAYAPEDQKHVPRLNQRRVHASLAVARLAFPFNPFRFCLRRTTSVLRKEP